MEKLFWFFIWCIDGIRHFINNDHKMGMFTGTLAAGTTGYVMSQKSITSLPQELLYRDINTAIMAVLSAGIGFFVTLGLKKYFDKKHPQ